jgi:hypothetical protein
MTTYFAISRAIFILSFSYPVLQTPSLARETSHRARLRRDRQSKKHSRFGVITLTEQSTQLPSFYNHSTPSYKMASRTLSRALRSPLTKQLSAPARRTFVSAINASARPAVRAAAASAQQVRGVKTIDFAGTKEDVYGKSFRPFHRELS